MLQKLLVVIVLGLLSCTTGIKVRNVNYSMDTIKRAIDSQLSMGIKKVTENGRALHTKPFKIKQNPKVKKEGYRDRGVATIWIIGDRPPYTLEADVIVQRAYVEGLRLRQKAEYVDHHHDDKIARKLLNKVLGFLDKRRSQHDVIDDFKSF